MKARGRRDLAQWGGARCARPEQIEDDAATLVDALHDLSIAVTESPGAGHESGALGWPGGGVLLHLYLRNQGIALANHAWLDQTLESLWQSIQNSRRSGLYQGLSGYAWLLARSAKLTSRPVDLRAVDAVLLDLVRESRFIDYDLTSGLVGVGVYGLERLPTTRGRAIVSSVVTSLERRGTLQSEGIAWHTDVSMLTERKRALYTDGCFDLGMAHGVAGVVAFLALVVKHRVAVDQASWTLEMATNWLLSCFHAHRDGWTLRSVYESPATNNFRLAWCYHELGAAWAVGLAGEALGRPEWSDFARRELLCLARVDPTASGVNDASVCHGSAGALHLFSTLHRRQGDPEFAAAADRWQELLLSQRREGLGCGGFPYWASDDGKNGRNESTPSFLEGGSGVGLVLLERMVQKSLGWDRLLLLA